MVENIDDNLDPASTSYVVKEKNLSGKLVLGPTSNETIKSSNNKINSCVFFICNYLLML